MTRALFICGKARRRSPTAADIAAGWGVETDFAGLSADADERLSAEQIDWAEVIFVMERRQKARLARQFALGSKRVVCLNIPDRYPFMDPGLIARLEACDRPGAGTLSRGIIPDSSGSHPGCGELANGRIMT